MPFDQSALVGVNPPLFVNGDLLLSWEGTLPAGRIWQIYIDSRLADRTPANNAHIPWPQRPGWFDIGSVLLSEANTSFADSLPARPRTHTTLSWEGGTFLDPADGDVKGFRVYGEATPGGGIDFATPRADIPAYTARVVTDGFGLGGFGLGGFGMSGAKYSWRSGPLASGTWNWAVRAYNSAGIEGATATDSDTITAPPAPPGLYDDGVTRLKYTVVNFGSVGFDEGGFGLSGPGQAQVKLFWNASPG